MIKGNGSFKLIGGLLAGMLIGGATIVCANQAIQALQNTEIKVSLNGQVQTFKDETTGEIQHPITYHDRTYLPLRNVAQLSGLNVDYDGSTNTAILNEHDFSIARSTYKESQAIYEKYDGLDYYLNEDASLVICGSGNNQKLQYEMKGFEGKVVSAIAIVRGDPSALEFPLYVLNDQGYVFYAGIGDKQFTKIKIENDLKFSDIAISIESDKPVVKQIEDGSNIVVYCEYYELYGKTTEGKIIMIDQSSSLWS
ncbi:MAG: hypothetical protein IKR04_01755 [Clostridia bacterium]|nr:hypothetical protein [Clostridia bacterium]